MSIAMVTIVISNYNWPFVESADLSGGPLSLGLERPDSRSGCCQAFTRSRHRSSLTVGARGAFRLARSVNVALQCADVHAHG
jgi:hypothetical protein